MVGLRRNVVEFHMKTSLRSVFSKKFTINQPVEQHVTFLVTDRKNKRGNVLWPRHDDQLTPIFVGDSLFSFACGNMSNDLSNVTQSDGCELVGVANRQADLPIFLDVVGV